MPGRLAGQSALSGPTAWIGLLRYKKKLPLPLHLPLPLPIPIPLPLPPFFKLIRDSKLILIL